MTTTQSFQPDPTVLNVMNTIRSDIGESDFTNMRGWYNAKFNADTSLNDEAILYVIAASDDDKSPTEWADDMKAHEMALAGVGDNSGDTPDTVHADNTPQHAVAVANTLAADKPFLDHLTAAILRKEQTEVAGVTIMQDMARVLGDAGMLALPFPDSRPAMSADGKRMTNGGLTEDGKQADHYIRKVTDGGKRKVVKGRVLNDIADDLPMGAVYVSEIKRAREAQAAKKMGPSEFGEIISLNQGRLNSLRGYVRQAVACFHNLEAINGMRKTIKVEGKPDTKVQKVEAFIRYKRDDAGNPIEVDGLKVLQDGRAPFKVQSTDSKNERDKVATYTVATFIKLRPDVAQANGADYDALVDTIGRETQTPEGDGLEIDDAATWFTYLEDVDSYAAGTAGYEAAMLWLTRNPKTRGSKLLTMQSIVDSCNGLLAKFEEELKEAKAAAKAAQQSHGH